MTPDEQKEISEALTHSSSCTRILNGLLSRIGLPPEPEPELPRPVKGLFGLCVGHSRSGDNGAVNTAGTSEWEWNTRLASLVQERLSGIGVDSVIYSIYEGGSYGEAMSWLAEEMLYDGITAAAELHFNSASPSAEGYEYLHWHSSEAGNELASDFIESHSDGFPSRQNRGAKPISSSDRGSGFVSKTHCPAVICEPFFGSSFNELEIYEERFKDLADVYAVAVYNFMTRLF